MAWARKKDSGGRNGKEITPFPPPKRMSAPPGESQEDVNEKMMAGKGLGHPQ